MGRWLAVVVLLCGCSTLPMGIETPADSGPDAPTVVARDTPDAAPDVAPAPVPDSAPDSGPAPSVDARAPEPDVQAVDVADTSDASDAGTIDAADSAPDAREASTDAGRDAAPDAAREAGPSPCVPARCGTHSVACWPMPNSPGSGLPNVASYTDMGDGVVRDNRTCLEWQQSPTTSTAHTWTAAKGYCEQQPYLGGGVGWRLPTRIELISIVNYSRTDPSIIASIFPGTLQTTYWTSSAYPGGVPSGFTVSFHDGTVSGVDQAAMYLARCVRGNGENPNLPLTPPDGRYAVGPVDVEDGFTGLTWQRGDSRDFSAAAVAWETADAYCNQLSFGDGAPWRLPSVQELATLVDESRFSAGLPAIDLAAFPMTAPSAYWSSTRLMGSAAHWTVDFSYGVVDSEHMAALARCVR
jgi:hypothetical protein